MPSPIHSLVSGPQNVAGAAEQLNGFLLEMTQDTVTALAGGGQTGATQITGQTARVSTVATVADSVMLPQALSGLELVLINDASNAMQVFGYGTDTIDGVASGTGVSQMGKSVVIYTCVTAGKWQSEGLATGFGGPGLQTFSFANALTAVTPASQSTALALTKMVNRVTTCSASGAGVALMTAVAGMEITVINDTANPLSIYPVNAGSDQINGLSSSTAVVVPGNTVATFLCTAATVWDMTLTSGKQAPVGAGATLTLTAANNNSTILMNTASGSVVTLPAATGSGIRFRFVTTVVLTSNFNKILAASSSDFIIGTIVTQVAAGTATGFQSPLATNHSIRTNGTTTGSAGVGEILEVEDIGANLWQVSGTTFSSGTVATPYNSATS